MSVPLFFIVQRMIFSADFHSNFSKRFYTRGGGGRKRLLGDGAPTHLFALTARTVGPGGRGVRLGLFASGSCVSWFVSLQGFRGIFCRYCSGNIEHPGLMPARRKLQRRSVSCVPRHTERRIVASVSLTLGSSKWTTSTRTADSNR